MKSNIFRSFIADLEVSFHKYQPKISIAQWHTQLYVPEFAYKDLVT